MRILAIDPGNEMSGWVVFDYKPFKLVECDHVPNDTLRLYIQHVHYDRGYFDLIVIETVKTYVLHTQPKPGFGGKRAKPFPFSPNDVVLTAIEIGRFIECASPLATQLVSRVDVRKHFLGRSTGNDSLISQAIYDRFGGTRKEAVGTKANPGPLYGLKGHATQALAAGLTVADAIHLQKSSFDPTQQWVNVLAQQNARRNP